MKRPGYHMFRLLYGGRVGSIVVSGGTESQDNAADWLDLSAFDSGSRMFQRNSQLVLVAFVTGVLIEGFATNTAKSFRTTGRVRERGVRRLKQNNRHMMDTFLPGGLARDGDG